MEKKSVIPMILIVALVALPFNAFAYSTTTVYPASAFTYYQTCGSFDVGYDPTIHPLMNSLVRDNQGKEIEAIHLPLMRKYNSGPLTSISVTIYAQDNNSGPGENISCTLTYDADYGTTESTFDYEIGHLGGGDGEGTYTGTTFLTVTISGSIETSDRISFFCEVPHNSNVRWAKVVEYY